MDFMVFRGSVDSTLFTRLFYIFSSDILDLMALMLAWKLDSALIKLDNEQSRGEWYYFASRLSHASGGLSFLCNVWHRSLAWTIKLADRVLVSPRSEAPTQEKLRDGRGFCDSDARSEIDRREEAIVPIFNDGKKPREIRNLTKNRFAWW